ncbi:hypothetical protein ACFR9U_12115, partial [Halorientalis brevis]
DSLCSSSEPFARSLRSLTKTPDAPSARPAFFSVAFPRRGSHRLPAAAEETPTRKRYDITFRRDERTKRPRVNKPGSQLDREQKKNGEYYYSA